MKAPRLASVADPWPSPQASRSAARQAAGVHFRDVAVDLVMRRFWIGGCIADRILRADFSEILLGFSSGVLAWYWLPPAILLAPPPSRVIILFSSLACSPPYFSGARQCNAIRTIVFQQFQTIHNVGMLIGG